MKRVDTTKVCSLKKQFEQLHDPRSTTNRKHLLSEVCVMAIAAIIAGADGPTDMNRWAKLKQAWLETFLTLPFGIPSKDCFARILARVDHFAFQECFLVWIKEIVQAKNRNTTSRTIGIDGKTMRRSGDELSSLAPVHMVSAWCSELGMTLGQIATEEKSNEITAIPQLLDLIDIEGDTVTIDAMGCQKRIAKKIIDKKGDYALAVKGNQKTLYETIIATFDASVGEHDVDADVHQFVTEDHGHGREETRFHFVSALPKSSEIRANWPGAKAIAMVIRQSEDRHGNSSEDRRYYLLSRFMSGESFAHVARSHWGIENTCHWVLDVVFGEDQHRTRDRQLAAALSFLKRFTIGLIKQHPLKDSIIGKRKRAGWNDEFLWEILEIQG